MTEIEKLYENAEIEKQIPDLCSNSEYYCVDCGAYIKGAKPYCKNADYPHFTAEKQLELLRLFGTKYESSDITKNSKEADIWSLYFNIFRKTKEGFDEALAGLFNFIWQDLTPEEKAEIKRILED